MSKYFIHKMDYSSNLRQMEGFMTAIELLSQEMTKLGLYEGNLPEYITDMMNSIPANSIPDRMKLALVMSEICTYAGEFRIGIKHWNGSMIPINAITFCIAKSGASKDSSARAIRKCFDACYKEIDEIRLMRADLVAHNKCKKAGKTETSDNLEKFYIAPNPLFLATSTAEGFIQHLNDMDEIRLGCGYIKAGEFGQELISNPNMTDILSLISEIYDTGDKELKAIKDRTMLSREVKAMPVSALFLGSQDNILYDKSVKSKFSIQFSTKLARRSTFVFADEPRIEKDDYTDVSQIINEEIDREMNGVKAREKAIEYIQQAHRKLVGIISDKANKGCSLTFTEEAMKLYALYKRFCEEDAEAISMQYSLTKLTRTHLHWKAFKLAGALALMDVNNTNLTIDVKHLRAAIEFEEMIYPDIRRFEDELSKDNYEIMASYCHNYCINHELDLPLHMIKKLGFIDGKIGKDTIPNLIEMLKSIDPSSVYIENENPSGIHFSEVIYEHQIGFSYKRCTGTKQERASKCADGFVYYKRPFEKLIDMLDTDGVYTPFEFKNGKRNGQNIVGGTKWICFDVDDSDIPLEDVHDMLGDITHIITTTSDPNNSYKFRLLVELQQYVDLPSECWIRFEELVANKLQIKADLLPQSQIFFSYKSDDACIYYNNAGEPLDVAYEIEESKKKKLKKKIPTKSELEQLINNPMDTFLPAYQAYNGEGRRKMVWVVRYGKELGMTKDQVIEVLNDINRYWTVPMNEKDFNNILKFCNKHFEEE